MARAAPPNVQGRHEDDAGHVTFVAPGEQAYTNQVPIGYILCTLDDAPCDIYLLHRNILDVVRNARNSSEILALCIDLILRGFMPDNEPQESNRPG